MKDDLQNYWASLWRDVPEDIWEVLVCVLVLWLIVIYLWKGWKRGIRISLSLLTVEYVFLLYCSTVIFRKPSDMISGYDFTPFWSYRAILSGECPQLFPEIIMNMVVFVPVGLLLGIVLDKIKLWHVMLIGWGVSLSIEMSQFVLKRGFVEVDDVIHNTLGCAIGYGLFLVAHGVWLKVNTYRKIG